MMISNVTIGVGFGTAALGDNCYAVVKMALEAGFRKFDTAEADWWYDQAAVGRALQDFFWSPPDDECLNRQGEVCGRTCRGEDLRISTKIPPWSLTSAQDIRDHAANSRQELVGFCEDEAIQMDLLRFDDETSGGDGAMITGYRPFPLDVYYIHAPTCWKGWHSRCDDHPPLLDLRSSWLAMEAVVGLDHSARRIGLSNVHPDELLDIIQFVYDRQQQQELDGGPAPGMAPPRLPDVLQAFADPIAPAEELRRICQEHDIEFVSYSTLGTQHFQSRQNPVLGSPIVQELASKYGRSTAEVVLSWALQRGMSVIPRSSQWQHIQELARLLSPQEANFLTEEDLAQVDAMKDTA